MKYYFDTSIWIDLFEDRNEPNLPKGEFIKRLLIKITNESHIIFYSDLIIKELINNNYTIFEIREIFEKVKDITKWIDTTTKQINKAKDLSVKRKIPKGDALHALIARDNKAILITRDKDFQKLLDITQPFKPEDLV